MIDLDTIGIAISKIPLNLTWIKTLKEENVGDPRLEIYENDNGESYIRKFCDIDEDKKATRWMIFRVTDEQLDAYLNNEISLLDLLILCIDKFVYIKDSVLYDLGGVLAYLSDENYHKVSIENVLKNYPLTDDD